MRLAVVLLIVSACEARPEVPIAVTRNGDPVDDLPDEIVDGCDVWGLDCWATGDDYDGPRVRLDLRDGIPDGENGATTEHRVCRKEAWAAAGKPKVVAHELGHIFWLGRRPDGSLEHSADPGNIMFFADNEGHTTEAQRQKVRRNAGRFVHTCP